MLTVRHETDADEALEAALDKWERAQDIWDSMALNLALDPTVGTPLNEPGTVRAWTIHGARSSDMPTLTVLYRRLDDNTISIEAAHFADATHYQIGHA